ncbi:minor capsid protein [Oscillospiraceae bacterium 50-58]|jgi:SPP1 gp7 family putative phage head morphogenesis protein
MATANKLLHNSDYWRKRFKAIENQANLTGADSLSYISAQYQEAAKTIEKQISTWYMRFANNNGISMHEAKQLLSGKDLEEFKWDVAQYIQYGEENALNGLWMNQLENASAKFHVSKLEALKVQNQAAIEALFGAQNSSLTDTLQAVYQSGYFHSCYEVQKAFGLGWNMAGIDEGKLSAVLSTPWTLDGSTFSDRLWTNKQKLIQEVQNTLTQGIMTGKKPDAMIADIQKKMNTSKTNAGRLVMTESAAMSAMGQKAAFGDLGVEEFEVVETLDHITCDVCAGMDGQHFPMSDYEIGVTVPPFHPWCRGCTCPYFNDEFTLDSERIARAEDGTQYYVPGDTTYEEWKTAFVDGDKSGFDPVVNPKSGLTSYKKHVEPEPPKPKKEYLTKKKLESLISDADTQIADLQEQFKTESGGWTYEEVVKDFGSLEDFADGDELTKLKGIQDQIGQIAADKDQWQELLDKKIVEAETKKLKKEALVIQDQLDLFPVKTYSGIWKDDVTTADWLAKHGSIQAKKDYFTNKLLNASDLDEMNKWKDLIQQLDEFDAEGKSYYDLQSQMKKIQADLQMLQSGGKIDDTAAMFTQARKDAAMWAKSTQAADARLRDKCGEVWRAATSRERHAIYDYTAGSGKFNRPLSGFEKPYSMPGSGWEPKYFKGVNQVWIDYEGAGDEIRAMTDIISRSTYDFDCWFQRGGAASEIESFLGLSPGSFMRMSEAELQQFVGVGGRRNSFTSCGVAKGKGFSGEIITNIYAPSGTQMMYAEPFSAFGQGSQQSWDGLKPQSYFGSESECIIQRGAYCEITKIEKSGNTVFIDMEVHPEQGYDTFQQDPNEWKGSTAKGR